MHNEKNPEYKRMRGMSSINYIIVIVLLLVAVFNISTLSNIGSSINEKIISFKENARPAEIEITRIVYSECESCFDVNSAINLVKRMETNVTEEKTLEWDSTEAKALIEKYGITILPTFLVTGETEKSNIASGLKKIGEVAEDGTVIFSGQELPYYDLSEQSVSGLVDVIYIIDSDCKECFDLTGLSDLFIQAGVMIASEEILEYDSQKAQEMITRYDISAVPSALISKDIAEYPGLSQSWKQLGAIEKPDYFLLEALSPPYIDLRTMETKGLVDLIYIIDESCSDCYNVTMHRFILSSMGISVQNEETYDVNTFDAKNLIKKYNITKVPTIIISPEAGLYTNLVSIWPRVGTVEDDGSFVFRNMEALGEDTIFREIGD